VVVETEEQPKNNVIFSLYANHIVHIVHA